MVGGWGDAPRIKGLEEERVTESMFTCREERELLQAHPIREKLQHNRGTRAGSSNQGNSCTQTQTHKNESLYDFIRVSAQEETKCLKEEICFSSRRVSELTVY